MISLTAEEFTDLCEPTSGDRSSSPIKFGQSTILPRRLGNGIKRSFHLREGLILEITEGHLKQSLSVKQTHETSFPLTSKFLLSGSSWVKTPGIKGIKSRYLEQKGFNYLYHLPDLEEVEEWSADEAIQVVMIYADTDYFNFLCDDNSLPQPLKNVLQGTGTHRFHQSLGPTSAMMHQLLRQILHCPYTGSIQALYLESKVLELLTFQLETWKKQNFPASKFALPADEVERLQQARDLLIQQADNPPLLIELAHQVGLNDRKLKQGFRQLFGTTVFGYLQNHRMLQAKQLLADSSLSIAGIASLVGYKNPEAFSTAFRRKFSMSPKAYQLNLRH